jgi:hypothetical protein
MMLIAFSDSEKKRRIFRSQVYYAGESHNTAKLCRGSHQEFRVSFLGGWNYLVPRRKSPSRFAMAFQGTINGMYHHHREGINYLFIIIPFFRGSNNNKYNIEKLRHIKLCPQVTVERMMMLLLCPQYRECAISAFEAASPHLDCIYGHHLQTTTRTWIQHGYRPPENGNIISFPQCHLHYYYFFRSDIQQTKCLNVNAALKSALQK